MICSTRARMNFELDTCGQLWPNEKSSDGPIFIMARRAGVSLFFGSLLALLLVPANQVHLRPMPSGGSSTSQTTASAGDEASPVAEATPSEPNPFMVALDAALECTASGEEASGEAGESEVAGEATPPSWPTWHNASSMEQPHEAGDAHITEAYSFGTEPNQHSPGMSPQLAPVHCVPAASQWFAVVPVWCFCFPLTPAAPCFHPQATACSSCYDEDEQMDPDACSSDTPPQAQAGQSAGGQPSAEATLNIFMCRTRDGRIRMQHVGDWLLEQLLSKKGFEGFKAHHKPGELGIIDGQGVRIYICPMGDKKSSPCVHFINGDCGPKRNCKLHHLPRDDVVAALKKFLTLVQPPEEGHYPESLELVDIPNHMDIDPNQGESHTESQDATVPAVPVPPPAEEDSSASTIGGSSRHGEEKQSAEAGEASGFAG